MGQYLQRIEGDTAAQLERAEGELAALSKSKQWEAVKTAADLTGIVDPTPASDAISMGMSIAEGDWVGAFLSGVSFVPYLGDTIAKPIKLARAAKTVAAIERKAAALAKTISHYKDAAIRIAQRKMAAAAERARRAMEAGKRWAESMKCEIAQRKMAAAAERARRAMEAGKRWAESMKCEKCPKPSNRFGTHLPTKGKWTDKNGAIGEKGNSRWTSEDGRVSLDYKEGYPDFATSDPPSIYPKGDGKVEIEMMGNKSDFGEAREAMRDKLGDRNWPGNGQNQPDGYTWHHTEDGVTMQLVNKNIHAKTKSGPAHVGGESIVSGKDNLKQQTQF
ncbi:MAG: HNH endonuclease [Proteobacteria bacterium]|nr:HNH endonuclease [Pseudomonadota bacterium]